ncbi:DUF1120 domain-containing protein [Pseudomonas sp. C1C7]|uniref:DUF1120 domain-containing protein n=1 Tax=Pseudomonas sp. C1C7 TaxID=2735272 RepID=UPI001585F5AB|nr:DUF1120 domain-containing protein [Pseudomonas sp. C1C7]NUT76542.1 DUF1120 domain-containing protein [Pseudomonas sp. C1C7]
MKNHFAAFTAVVLIGLAPHVLAASSTDLTVTGTITPVACMPTLPNGGVVDFGKIAARDLNLTSDTILEPKTLNLEVNCPATALLAAQLFDNRKGTASLIAPWAFGLGLINGTQKLGHYTMFTERAEADGMPGQAIVSLDQGASWSTNIILRSDHYLAVAASDDWSKPVAVQNMKIQLNLTAAIARADGLDLSNEVSLDGSTTFEVKYL